MLVLSFALLGPVQIQHDGHSLRFRTSKVQALLIYLAVEARIQPAARHRREALMELLWPGLPLPSAQDNLRQILYQLRKAVPAIAAIDGGLVPLVLVDRQSVQLNPAAAIDLDTVAFEQLLRQPPSIPALEAAAALYRGDFLADFYVPDSAAFEAWAASQRATLRRQALDGLEHLLRLCVEQAQHVRAEAAIRRQLELDDLRESAHRQLMALLAQTNRRNEALVHYSALVALLKQELNVAPDQETVALYDAIAAQRMLPQQMIPIREAEQSATISQPEVTPAQEERRWVTVVCADIAQFTSLVQATDPEDIKVLAERWMACLCEDLAQFGGTIVSSVSTQIVAVFGAPISHEDDAERALRAGLAIADRRFALDGERPLRARCVVTTGDVLAGQGGPPDRRVYTVVGDAVNAAILMLPAVPPGAVWIGAETYLATRQVVTCRRLPPFAESGAHTSTPVWHALRIAASPHARPVGTAPFIGRERELELLAGVWQRAIDARQPHLVTLLGEAGIGKSRLVAEFEEYLSGAVVLHGTCQPYGTALSYGALEAIVKRAAGVTARDDTATARHRLEALVGQVLDPLVHDRDRQDIIRHLALMTGLDLESDREGAVRDERTFRVSAHRFLVALARREPLCLVFDNLQWAEAALLDLIEYVATHAHDVPLLIIVQSRPEFVERRAAWGARVPSHTPLRLAPLGVAAQQALLQALCRERRLPEHMALHLGRSTGGNPLYAEELVAMVAEQGSSSGIPFAIKRLISARLDTLPPHERQTLQYAAVLGNTCWEGGVRALAEHDVSAQLESLAQKGVLWLQPRSHYPGEHEFAFKHDLIRDVAYSMLPRAERRRLHGRAADWLEQIAGKQNTPFFDVMAHHALQAEQHQRALTYLMRAAEQAGRATAQRQEASLLLEAITLAERLGQPALVADLHARRGRAFVDLGMWAEAARDLEAALHGLGPDQPEQRVQVLVDLAWAKFWLVDIAGQSDAAIEAMELAERVAVDALKAKALFAVGFSRLNNAELQASQDMCLSALRYAEGTPIRERAMAFWASGLVSLWRGDLPQAAEFHLQAVQLGYAQHDPVPPTTALPQLGLALAGSGHYDQADAVFTEMRRSASEYERWPFLARALSMAAGFHLDLFDYAGHEQIATEAQVLARSIGFAPPAISSGIDLLLNYARRQDVQLCRKVAHELAETVEQSPGVHGWLWRVRFAEAQAEAALARGAWHEALQHAETGIARSRAFGRVKYVALSLHSRARALAALGQTNAAIADLQQALALVRSIGDPALFLRVASTLLSVAGDDELLAETYATVLRIRQALPNADLRRHFEAAEPVRAVENMTGSPGSDRAVAPHDAQP
jgi:DNA-binding SARP family transcriptional activator